MGATIAFRVSGKPAIHGYRSASLRSADASPLCMSISIGTCRSWTKNLTGVRRVQFALPGRTAT